MKVPQTILVLSVAITCTMGLEDDEQIIEHDFLRSVSKDARKEYLEIISNTSAPVMETRKQLIAWSKKNEVEVNSVPNFLERGRNRSVC